MPFSLHRKKKRAEHQDAPRVGDDQPRNESRSKPSDQKPEGAKPVGGADRKAGAEPSNEAGHDHDRDRDHDRKKQDSPSESDDRKEDIKSAPTASSSASGAAPPPPDEPPPYQAMPGRANFPDLFNAIVARSQANSQQFLQMLTDPNHPGHSDPAALRAAMDRAKQVSFQDAQALQQAMFAQMRSTGGRGLMSQQDAAAIFQARFPRRYK